MTREEKIAELINIRDNFNYTLAPREVFDDAIKALEQEPSGDLISRQATIEAFQMFRGYEANRTNAEWVDRIETVVEKLPPVNPQESKTGNDLDMKLKLMEANINGYTQGLKDASNTEQEPCDNAVSRQAVMNCIDGYSQMIIRPNKLKEYIDRLLPVNPQEPLTEEDYIELNDRFGDYVEFVVRDMVSGKGERWLERSGKK